MGVLVGKNPTLPGVIPQWPRVSFEDFPHVKKKKKKKKRLTQTPYCYYIYTVIINSKRREAQGSSWFKKQVNARFFGRPSDRAGRPCVCPHRAVWLCVVGPTKPSTLNTLSQMTAIAVRSLAIYRQMTAIAVMHILINKKKNSVCTKCFNAYTC